MAYLQELGTLEINQAVESAAERNVPVSLTVGRDGQWASFRSRFLAVRDGRLILAQPAYEEAQTPYEFTPGEKVNISFKFRHYKHMSTATVAGCAPFVLDDGTRTVALAVVCPTRMQRAQRRLYQRADVPEHRTVRASFWLGGAAFEPTAGAGDTPVWSGRVMNLSAGGVQVRTSAQLRDFLDAGDVFGIHVSFGAGDATFTADAQFRHMDPVDGEFLLGFQFVGLEHSAEGRKILQTIGRKLAELLPPSTRSQSRRPPRPQTRRMG